MRKDISGKEALLELNDFLEECEESYRLGRGPVHSSLALGNEATPLEELPLEYAVIGEIHGKLRSLVGGLGGLVDRDALPENVRGQWTELQQIESIWRTHVRSLTHMVDQKNKACGYKKYIYKHMGDLDEYENTEEDLLHYIQLWDKALASRERKELGQICEQYRNTFSAFLRTMNETPSIPLRLHQEGQEDIAVTIPNEMTQSDHSLLTTLVLLKTVSKDGQLSTLKHPISLGTIGVSAMLAQTVEKSLLGGLSGQPEAATLSKVLDSKLRQDIHAYMLRLQERYGEKLAATGSPLACAFAQLQERLGMDAKMPGDSTICAANHEGRIEDKQQKAAVQDAASKCPYLRSKNGFLSP